jgi:hypothetical protein
MNKLARPVVQLVTPPRNRRSRLGDRRGSNRTMTAIGLVVGIGAGVLSRSGVAPSSSTPSRPGRCLVKFSHRTGLIAADPGGRVGSKREYLGITVLVAFVVRDGARPASRTWPARAAHQHGVSANPNWLRDESLAAGRTASVGILSMADGWNRTRGRSRLERPAPGDPTVPRSCEGAARSSPLASLGAAGIETASAGSTSVERLR